MCNIWYFIKLSLCVFTSIFVNHSLPVEAYRITTTQDVLAYLSRFGYLEEQQVSHIGNVVKNKEIREALQDFQEMSHISQAGKITRQTLNKMNTPRCGNRDRLIWEGDEVPWDEDETATTTTNNNHTRRRIKRSVIVSGKKWEKRQLTYKILKFPSNTRLNPRAIQREFDQAFKYWEKVANLKFKKISSGRADINIKFVRGYHGDNEAFDGPGKSLAHGFYPTLSAIHMDDHEMWSTSDGIKKRHYDVRTVAVHELGHALGLGHSSNSQAVMYFQYKGHRTHWGNFSLHTDDVQAIQTLYGKKKEKGQNRRKSLKFLLTAKSITMDKPDLCLDTKFDAITAMADGFIYIFKDEYFFRLDNIESKVSNDYPRLINSTFFGLPSHLDAVLTVQNKTYFFKDSKYWRSTGTNMDDGYPQQISSHFRNIPNNLNAACIWSSNGKPYFFKGKNYWMYNKKSEMQKSYPKSIFEHWPGLPDHIGACFLAPNNRTYFFKNDKYWKFHSETSESEAKDYPRLINKWWFQCSSAGNEKN